MSSFRPLIEIDRHWPACGQGSWDQSKFSDFTVVREDPTSGIRQELLSRAIETEVIPRLMLAHRQQDSQLTGKLREVGKPNGEEVAEFARLLMSHDAEVARCYVAAVRARGMPLDIVLIELFSPAAQYLGELWNVDLCDFTDVTIALSRLQQLLRELSPEFQGDVNLKPDARRALLVAAPGEQHTFGILVVQEFFRSAGWDVQGGLPYELDELVDVARSEPFDVVGLSVSCDASVDALTSFIRTLRKVAMNPAVHIVVGGRFFLEHPDFVTRVGADTTAPNGRRAVHRLSSLLDTNPMRY